MSIFLSQIFIFKELGKYDDVIQVVTCPGRPVINIYKGSITQACQSCPVF